MVACILAFLGIYTALLGLAGFIVNMWWKVTLFDFDLPITVVCLVIGFLVSLCVLGYIRMMGELSGDEDSKVIQLTFKATMRLGFYALIASAALQGYLRVMDTADQFFLQDSESIKAALASTEPVISGMLFFVSMALPVFIGLPIFILLFFQQSFQEYVTVSYREIGGMNIEMSRSDSYLPIWPTLLIAILISAVILFLSVTPLIFLLIIPFAIYIYGCPDKNKMITAGVISGIIALAALIYIFVA